jgi:hypothetical protein
MTIDTSPEHERSKERVIQFTNLGRVHKLIEERITNSPDGGVEINYVNDDDEGFRLARVDMAKDGMVYVIFWDRHLKNVAGIYNPGGAKVGNVLNSLQPSGATCEFSEEMMPVLIHRIKNFLASGIDL